jgi:hypothetical protein
MPANRLLFIALFAISLAACRSEAAEADFRPFGVTRQTLPSSLNCKPVYPETPPNGSGQYACDRLPEGNADFQQYILAFVSGVGICNVTGVSPFIADDWRGAQTRTVFGRILAWMSRDYGPPDERVDHLADGGRADDNQFEADVIAERRQIFDQWNSLTKIDAAAESASLAISGSEELGLSVYGVVRFSGNDTCMQKLEAATSSIDPQ